jgi:hypothetical protein
MGRVVSLLGFRYTKLYREQLALWLSRGLGLKTCHQIAAHICRDEFLGRIKSAEMKSLNARLRDEQPPAVPCPLGLEEAS